MSEKFVVKSTARDLASFAKLVTVRRGKFKKGAETPLPREYAVNRTARLLHPKEQKLIVSKVIEHGSDAKSYVLICEDGGKPAYFRAGQYLSVNLCIGGSFLTRPYSIASTPKRALGGEYMITVKRVGDGFASEFILDNWKQGSPVSVPDPDGTFYYEPIRDAETVIGIAGGSGITPFLSIAGAIADGTENADLVLLYGCRTAEDILFREELDELCAQCGRIKVVYVLSDSDEQGYEHGFITAQLIEKYAPEKYSVFLCGPQAMYNFAAKELEKLGIERKYVRFELFSGAKPESGEVNVYTCKVRLRGGEELTIPCRSDESILTALEKGGVRAQSKCRGGECGFCRCKLISGEVAVLPDNDGRRIGDIKFGYIHPCSAFARGDVAVKL